MRFVILIGVVLVAALAGLAALLFSGNPPPAASVETSRAVGNAPDVATVDVLVARVDIPLGTTIDSSMIDIQPWPRNLVPEGFIVSGSPQAAIEGKVARADFQARDPLMLAKLGGSDDASFLAGALPAGMRAVTVAVDSISGVAGYLLPGDRVDVVLAHNIPLTASSQLYGSANRQIGGGALPRAAISEVLLAGVRVLAVNDRKPPQPPQQPGQQQQQAPQRVEPPANVTLELSQEDVKKIRLAEKNGSLSLALRSLKDADDASTGTAVTLYELSRFEGGASNKRWGTNWRSADHAAQAGGGEVSIIRGTRSSTPGMTGVPSLPAEALDVTPPPPLQ